MMTPREAFETWATSDALVREDGVPDFTRDPSGSGQYLSVVLQLQWESWHAGIAWRESIAVAHAR